MFHSEDRDRLRDRVLELAEADERVVSGAVVGSLALDQGDRWSDVDLTFGIADDASVLDVLDEWSPQIESEFDAVRLFDLSVGTAVYRVFLMPESLQLDLSMAPATDLRASSPRFRLLFGDAKKVPPPSPAPHDLAGWGVLHARTARVCIAREKWWMAEYFITAVRQHSLALACLRLGLPTGYARGFDQLPADLLDAHSGSFAMSLQRDELLRAANVATDLLERELGEHPDLDPRLPELLRQATAID